MQHLVETLTQQQLRYVECLADPSEARSQEEIAQEIGVSRETLWRWRRMKGFGEFVYSIALLYVKAEFGHIFNALTYSAKQGNPQAIRLIFEVTGILQPQVSRKLMREQVYTGDLEYDHGRVDIIKRMMMGLSNEQRQILRDAFDKVDSKLFDWAIVTEDISVQEAVELQVGENAHAA